MGTYLIRRHFKISLLYTSIALACGTFGCNSSIVEVRQDLARQGFAMLYPPEQGIEPGQIWLADGTLKAKFMDRPRGLAVQKAPAYFATLHENVNAKQSLKLLFTKQTMGKVGLLTKELNDAGVFAVTLDFGKQEIVQISPNELLVSDPRDGFGTAYGEALRLVRDEAPGLMLVSAVARVSGMRYIIRLDDPLLLMSRMTQIQSIVDAPIKAEIVSKHLVEWTIAGDRQLALGFTPVRGVELTLDAASARRAAGKMIAVAVSQPEILGTSFRIEVPAIQPVIAGDAAAYEVQAIYRKFVKDAELYWRRTDAGHD